jgi:outer membrane translocation and assembly module TamA
MGVSDLLSGTIKTDSSKVSYRSSNPGGFSFDRFYTLNSNVKYYFSTTPRLTFAISGNALFMTDGYHGTYQNNFYLLGGYQSLNKRSIPMVGFHANEIPIKSLAAFGTEIDYEISRNLHLNLTVNIAAIQEASGIDTSSALAGYGLGVGYMTIAGPMRAGIMQGFYNNDKFRRGIKGYISLGYNF